MTLWFVFALMTVAAIFAVLWPLSRGAASQAGGSEAVVYKDQLAEIDRDVAAGLIGRSEAEAARVEISRRLLAAADGERDLPAQSNLEIAPFVGRAGAGRTAGRSGCALSLARIAATRRFSAWPRAPAPPTPISRSRIWWRRSRRIWRRIRPMAAAGTCWRRCWRGSAVTTRRSAPIRNSITYNGDSAERRSDLGEALAGSAGGVVTAEAKAEFERAVALNADDPKANYFLGLAAEQDGRNADAASIWRAMLAKAPADAPWRPLVQAALVRVGGPAPRRRCRMTRWPRPRT